jgi:hypothetical protein
VRFFVLLWDTVEYVVLPGPRLLDTERRNGFATLDMGICVHKPRIKARNPLISQRIDRVSRSNRDMRGGSSYVSQFSAC